MLTEDQITELETANKRIAHVVGKGGAWEVVLRKPTRAEYKRFNSMAQNPAQAPDALEHFLRVIVVSPSRDAFDALLEDFPGIPAACQSKVTDLIGASTDETVK